MTSSKSRCLPHTRPPAQIWVWEWVACDCNVVNQFAFFGGLYVYQEVKSCQNLGSNCWQIECMKSGAHASRHYLIKGFDDQFPQCQFVFRIYYINPTLFSSTIFRSFSRSCVTTSILCSTSLMIASLNFSPLRKKTCTANCDEVVCH